MKLHKSESLLSSFKDAISGIKVAFMQERNLKIHTLFLILVIILGIVVKLTLFEWIVCIMLIGIVLGAELINTAIESAVDLASPEIHDFARQAKDIAAGAVLVFAITSAVVGAIIFVPKIISLIN